MGKSQASRCDCEPTCFFLSYLFGLSSHHSLPILFTILLLPPNSHDSSILTSSGHLAIWLSGYLAFWGLEKQAAIWPLALWPCGLMALWKIPCRIKIQCFSLQSGARVIGGDGFLLVPCVSGLVDKSHEGRQSLS